MTKTPRSTQLRQQEQQVALENWMKNLPRVTDQERSDWNQEVFRMLSDQDQKVLQDQVSKISGSDQMAEMQEAIKRISAGPKQDFFSAVTLNPKLGLIYRTLMTLLYVSGLLYPEKSPTQIQQLEGREGDLMQSFQLSELGSGSYNISLRGHSDISFPVSKEFLELSERLPSLIDQVASNPLNKALSPKITEVVLENGTTVTTIKGITVQNINPKAEVTDSIRDTFDERLLIVTVTDDGNRIRVSVTADDGSFVDNLNFLDLSNLDVGSVLDLSDGTLPAVSFQPLGENGEIIMEINFSLLPSGVGSAEIEFDRIAGLMRLTKLITQAIETATATATATPSITQLPSTTPAATSDLPSNSASTTVSPTGTTTVTVSSSPSESSSLSESITSSVTSSATNSPTSSATNSPTSSDTASVSVSISSTGVPSVTITLSPTDSASISASLPPSFSGSQTTSSTPTVSETNTVSPTTSVSVSSNPSGTPTTSVSITLSPSESAIFLASLSKTPSGSLPVSFTPSTTSTGSPTFSITPSPIPSPTPTSTPSKSGEVSTSTDVSQSVSFSLSPSASESLTKSVSPSISKILNSASPTPTPTQNSTREGVSAGGGSSSLSLGFLALLVIPFALGAYCVRKKSNAQANHTGGTEAEPQVNHVFGIQMLDLHRIEPQIYSPSSNPLSARPVAILGRQGSQDSQDSQDSSGGR